jgi:hypothetical protein
MLEAQRQQAQMYDQMYGGHAMAQQQQALAMQQFLQQYVQQTSPPTPTPSKPEVIDAAWQVVPYDGPRLQDFCRIDTMWQKALPAPHRA